MSKYVGLHVALVGCGQWGKNHARVLHELGVRLTYCDADSARLSSVTRQFPGHAAMGDVDRVLADRSVMAVVIATPAATHYDLVMRALGAGKHVLVEKPMALDPADGARLVALAKSAGRTLMVGHLLRYHPAVRKLKELVAAGALGELRYIYSNRLNLGRVRREENALWSFAPHDISVILHLAEETPVSVSCTGGSYLQARVADVSLSSLTFRSGIRSHIFVSWLHPFKEQKLVVVGSEHMAVFDDVQKEHKLVLYDCDVQNINGEFVTRPASPANVATGTAEPLFEEDRHFLDAILANTRPDTSGEEGLAVLTVLDACQRSLDTGGAPVTVNGMSDGAYA